MLHLRPLQAGMSLVPSHVCEVVNGVDNSLEK